LERTDEISDCLLQLMDCLNWRVQNEIDSVLAVSSFLVYKVFFFLLKKESRLDCQDANK
jgi:hypothetical protein